MATELFESDIASFRQESCLTFTLLAKPRSYQVFEELVTFYKNKEMNMIDLIDLLEDDLEDVSMEFCIYNIFSVDIYIILS